MLRRYALACCLLVVLGILLPGLAYGNAAVAAAAPVKFKADLPGAAFDRQSSVIGEISPDSPGKEVAIAGGSGTLFLLSSGGQLLWQQQVPPSLCANPAGGARLQNAPAVGDLDGDGTPELVIGYGTLGTDGCPGGVAAFDGRTGGLKWRKEILRTNREPLNGVFSVPALADVDGDGTLEVAFGSFDRHFYLLNANGSLIWRFHTADTVWSSPAFADVDADGRLDVVFGADIAKNGTFKTIDGGFVYAFKTLPIAGLSNQTIPFEIDLAKLKSNYGLLWRTPAQLPNYDQTIYSSPALADLDGNGSLEVVVGSACYYPLANGPKNGRWVKVLDAASGAELRTMTLETCSRSSPAIGDLNGDGTLDIAINATGEGANGGNGVCNVYAFSGSGQKLWQKTARVGYGSGGDPGCDNIQAPVIADVDGNGSQEVLTVSGYGVAVLDGTSGNEISGPEFNAPPALFFGQTISHGTPAVGDLDGDGVLEVAAAAGDSLFVWTNLSAALSSTPGTGTPYSAAWPMFHGNPQRSGTPSAPPGIRISAGSLSTLLEAGSAARGFILGFAGDDGLAWTASKDQPWITLGKAAGSTPDTLVITLDPTGKQPGVYTGKVTISSNAPINVGAATLAQTSREISIEMTVAESVTGQYLPLVRR